MKKISSLRLIPYNYIFFNLFLSLHNPRPLGRPFQPIRISFLVDYNSHLIYIYTQGESEARIMTKGGVFPNGYNFSRFSFHIEAISLFTFEPENIRIDTMFV